MLFRPPVLDDDDHRVIAEIDGLRLTLRHHLREPRRWTGQLRRHLRARAIRGSNSIEGYDVSLDDALALMEDEEPLDADRRTALEIIGYRNALTYIQQLAADSHFALDASLLRSLHFMMLGHDLAKSPGRYRQGPIFVHDDEKGQVVYEAPDATTVAGLVDELVDELRAPSGCPFYVRAAMAHLNLVMIHPFRDGNGRMARALQTLILARERILAPEFSSIEEWLGRNTGAYYDVLASVGAGRWSPGRDTREWVRFNLTAHHLQAQIVLRRVEEAGRIWSKLDEIVVAEHLPERALLALYPAVLGLRVRRPVYERDAEIEPATAGRDLRLMSAAGLLEARGETRARHYVGTERLHNLRRSIVDGRARLTSPYDVD